MELNKPALKRTKMRLMEEFAGHTEKREYENNKGYFTIKEMVKNIVEFEKEARQYTDWLGEIDECHIFFEGLEKVKEGEYKVKWGS